MMNVFLSVSSQQSAHQTVVRSLLLTRSGESWSPAGDSAGQSETVTLSGASTPTTCPHTPRHYSESLTTVNMSSHSPSQKCEVSGRKLKDIPQSKAGQLDVAVTY